MLESCLYARGVRDTVYPYSTRPIKFTLVEDVPRIRFSTRKRLSELPGYKNYVTALDGLPDKDKRRVTERSECEGPA